MFSEPDSRSFSTNVDKNYQEGNIQEVKFNGYLITDNWNLIDAEFPLEAKLADHQNIN